MAIDIAIDKQQIPRPMPIPKRIPMPSQTQMDSACITGRG
jgi:hypothetical protein